MTHQTKPLENQFDRLEIILSRMESLIRKNDFEGAETLSHETELIVEQLADSHLSLSTELKTRCRQAAEKYKKLVLMLCCAQTALYQQMVKLENGKKINQVYK